MTFEEIVGVVQTALVADLQKQHDVHVRELHSQIENLQAELAAINELMCGGGCRHVTGGFGDEMMSANSCINWHQYATGPEQKLGPWQGICKECGREFKPEDKDYKYWLRFRNRNRSSTSGIAFTPTLMERTERRVWEKTCREYAESRVALGLDEFDLPLVSATTPEEDREELLRDLKEMQALQQ